MQKQKLQDHQEKAIKAILDNLQRGEQKMLLNLATGTGVSSVLLELIKILNQKDPTAQILLLVHTKIESDQLKEILQGVVSFNNRSFYDSPVLLMTYTKFEDMYQQGQSIPEFKYIICLEAQGNIGYYLYNLFKNSIFIGFVSNYSENKRGIFFDAPLIYSYTFENAVRDGLLYPSLDTHDSAIEGFCERLFSRYGKINTNENKDFLLYSGNEILYIEVKTYRDQKIPIQVLERASSQIVHSAQANGYRPLLVLFAEVPNSSKEYWNTEGDLTIWDISNLLYYAKDDDKLLSELTRLTYFSIADIDPQKSCGWNPPDIVSNNLTGQIDQTTELLDRLELCKTGRKYAKEYEQICSDIVKFLFEDSFSVISDQHRTKDELFRMDLLCSLKGDGAFWEVLKHHYNSRFVVFEFKNYTEQLKQNLIFIAEKYLFNAALRNVAIIISRQGFSKNAANVANGCLKESGKLIMDIKDEDLKEMLQLKAKGFQPSDYLLKKLDELLMSISK